jgi:hypothetical protein
VTTSVAARAEQALACVQELRPATITDSSGASIAYSIQHLDNKLALMAMLHALPRDEYGDFVLSLMRTKDLSRKDVEAAFQVKQTECNASRVPLYTPASDTALCTQDTHCGNCPAPSGTPTTPSKGCGFCEALNHEEASCWAKERAADTVCACTKELQEERSKNKKAGCASRATAAAAGTSTRAATKATVTESAAHTSVCLAGTHNTHADTHWITDLGATSHMSTQRLWFKTFEPHVVPIRVANNAIVYSEGIGLIVMEPLDKSLDPVCLSRVLYVPVLQNNLFAVLHLVTSHRFRIVIKGIVMEFLRNSVRILTATIRDKTTWLNVRTVNALESALRGETICNCSLWHHRLGHIGKDLLEKLIKGKLASGLHLDSDAPLLVHCKLCIVGKHHANPFPAKASHRATRMLERVHSDLHMVPTATASGYCYWMTFIDDRSRYGWIYLLKHKSDAFKAFKTFKAMVEKQYNLPILCFHEDKGGEYIGHVWDEFFAEHGIWREHTVTGLSQQNGVAERRNCTLKEHIIAMLNNARLPMRFWGEALSYYAWLLNMCPSAAIPANTTPYEMVNKHKPNYLTLCVFGCRAWAHVRKDKCRSLKPHAKPCVFLGIPDNFKGWKLWDPLAQGGRGGVIISCDVVWNKEEFPGTSKTTLDPVLAGFGRPADAEPVPEAPEHKEMEDNSDNAGGALRRLPGTLNVGLDPGHTRHSSTGSSSSSSSNSEDSEPPPAPMPPAPHTPPCPVVCTPVPATPHPACWQIETPTGHCCAPAPAPAPVPVPVAAAPELRRSTRSQAGVPLNPTHTATQYLHQGRPPAVCIPMYSKTRSRSSSVQPADAAAPGLPNVKEESDHAPGPSQTPAESDLDVNPFYTAPVSPDKFDFLSGPHAADSAHVVQRWQGMRALLAQGIESVYSEDNKHLLLPQALERAFAACSDKSEPRTLRDTLKRPDADLWYQAAVKEVEVHIENGTWELVKLPPGCKTIGSQWVFKVKCNTDGSVEHYKACVVAQGFSQRPGVDFDETFAPTTKWAALRVIFALAALEDWELESVDISNAYLNGELKDVEVYMHQPEGFAEKDNTWVACLLKGLYGLKQGGREWFKWLEQVLSQLGFTHICADGSIFIWAKDGVQVICPVFVDDITFASKSKAKIAELKAAIAKHFKLRDLGPTTFQLGVEIIRDRKAHTLHLTQHCYCLDLLEHYGFVDCSPVSTPMDPGVCLSTSQSPSTPEDEAFMCTVPYVSAIGVLMYLAIVTCLDIAYAVGILCRFMARPRPEHWKAIKHLFCYLRSTCNFRLTYKPKPSAPHPFYAYSDADHGANLDNGCSTSAYVVKIGSGAVLWLSCLQSIVALSTTDTEFVAAASASQEVVWMRALLGELGFPISGPSLLLLDNQSAIQAGKNPEHHGHMKHLDLRFYWLRVVVVAGQIVLRYVPTADMAANLLTKGLARIKVAAAWPQLGLTAP